MPGNYHHILFALPPETAHRVALTGLAAVSRSRALCSLLAAAHRMPAMQTRKVMGLRFRNAVGLAAGFDKDAAAANALHALGFGWLELGTVTPRAQPGNAKPRLFRLGKHRAIINRMGFNSCGLDAFVANLARADGSIIIGVNLGANTDTPISRAADDYLAGLDAVHARADYVAVNVSCPNTGADARELQRRESLAPLLARINRRRMELADVTGKRMPLVLKIAPDLTADDIRDIANLARQHNIDGIAATNTSTARPGVADHAFASEAGGLSGAPIAALATETIHRLHQNLQGEIPIIGLGGILSATDAAEKLQAGADLVQLYTGFIYNGARLIREIVSHLAAESAAQSADASAADRGEFAGPPAGMAPAH